MKRHDIFSGIALLASLVAIIIGFTTNSNRDNHTASDEQLEPIIDEKIEQAANALRSELVERLDKIIVGLNLPEPEHSSIEDMELATIVQEAKHNQEIAQLLRQGIESVILNQMADELASVDWLDTLSTEKLQKLLTKTATASLSQGFRNFQTPIDVSDIDSIDGKIARILEDFEGVNSYTHDNALVKQMAAMGDEAIEPLINRLNNTSIGHSWAMKMAITDSLEELLTDEHEDLIIAEFTKHGNFSKLIEKYQFPAAEDEVMNKIMRPTHGRVDNNIVDAALKMDSDRSIPLLIDHVSNGQGVSYAASQLAAEGIDITEPLKMASSRAANTWERAALVELCLEREMPEGYDLAIQVLRSTETHAEHSQEKVYQYLRKYTGINGSYAEAADWLQENQPF